MKGNETFQKILVTWDDVFIVEVLACVRVLYLSVQMTKNWLPNLVGGSGPGISTATNSKSTLSGSYSSLRLSRSFLHISGQSVQDLIAL